MSDRADDEGGTETAVAGGEDRIGALPDEVLTHMMSFLLSREAMRTCVLAKRWRTLWKSAPALRIDDPESYDGATGSSTFVDELLRLRDPTPLNVCIITSRCMEDDDSEWAEEAFQRMEPWLRGEASGAPVLKGLSGATNLEVEISLHALLIFRNNFKWGHMFSNLKTLLLSEWCVVDDFTGLVYFLQHAPLLEELTLQLDLTYLQRLIKKDGSRNSSEQSLLSKHLKLVKIICDAKEDTMLHDILKILLTHGVRSEQIDIH